MVPRGCYGTMGVLWYLGWYLGDVMVHRGVILH